MDQCGLPKSTGIESIVRHIQFAGHEVKKPVEAKRAPDNSEHFLGRTRRAGGALICPEILKWVAQREARSNERPLRSARLAVEAIHTRSAAPRTLSPRRGPPPAEAPRLFGPLGAVAACGCPQL